MLNTQREQKQIIHALKSSDTRKLKRRSLSGCGVLQSKKDNPHRLWLAIDRDTRKISAFTFGRSKDSVFKKLKTLSEPFGITMFYTDDRG